MAASQFFIVFPEKDGVHVTSSFFVVSSIASDYLSQVSETLRVFKSIFTIENYTLYYDKSNYLNFRDAFVLDREERMLLRNIVNQALEWNDESCAIPHVCQCTSIWYKSQVPHNTLSEAALRKRFDLSSVAIIQYNIPLLAKSILPVVIGGNTINLDILPLDLLSMHKWISENRRPQRKYLWNPKHGEFGKHVIANPGEDVSPLLSSRKEAETLLPYAIGSKHDRKLYIYDDKQSYYEEFMPGVNNYHSYHLLEDETVPRSVIANLRKLGIARR